MIWLPTRIVSIRRGHRTCLSRVLIACLKYRQFLNVGLNAGEFLLITPRRFAARRASSKIPRAFLVNVVFAMALERMAEVVPACGSCVLEGSVSFVYHDWLLSMCFCQAR